MEIPPIKVLDDLERPISSLFPRSWQVYPDNGCSARAPSQRGEDHQGGHSLRAIPAPNMPECASLKVLVVRILTANSSADTVAEHK